MHDRAPRTARSAAGVLGVLAAGVTGDMLSMSISQFNKEKLSEVVNGVLCIIEHKTQLRSE